MSARARLRAARDVESARSLMKKDPDHNSTVLTLNEAHMEDYEDEKRDSDHYKRYDRLVFIAREADFVRDTGRFH
jgi:hypothetical protein